VAWMQAPRPGLLAATSGYQGGSDARGGVIGPDASNAEGRELLTEAGILDHEHNPRKLCGYYGDAGLAIKANQGGAVRVVAGCGRSSDRVGRMDYRYAAKPDTQARGELC
jgi:hypothetical protein